MGFIRNGELAELAELAELSEVRTCRLAAAGALLLCAAISTTIVAQDVPPAPRVAITYHAEPLAEGDLPRRFSPAQLATLEKLNRRDLGHLARLTELIVPDAWPEDEWLYEPGTTVVVQGEVDFKNATPWTVAAWWGQPLQLMGK